MSHYGGDTCEICGIERGKSDRWFLLLEDRWQDTLKILRWEPHLAPELGIQRLCCSAHLQQLVCQWMLAGSLAYVPADMPLKDLLAHKSDTPLRNIAREPEIALALLDAVNALLENFGNDSVQTDSMICDA